MRKKQKKIEFICSACGKELESEAKFLEHCAKKHPNDHYIVFDTIGRFVNIDHATTEYTRLNTEFIRQRQEMLHRQKQHIEQHQPNHDHFFDHQKPSQPPA